MTISAHNFDDVDLNNAVSGTNADQADHAPSASEMADIMMSVLSDGLDHPELWEAIPEIIGFLPDLPTVLFEKLKSERHHGIRASLTVLIAICASALGQTEQMIAELEFLAINHSQSPLVQGAIFWLKGTLAPYEPRYNLKGRMCPLPFIQLDVLERTTHQCCASWLQTSAGDLSREDWHTVWNSPAAQSVRESIHDGSFRHCNKIACPRINEGQLPQAKDLAQKSAFWRELIESRATVVDRGPQIVNLAYDRTCNLSCPSCRVEKFAADQATRDRFEEMQERAILPMLKQAKIVFVTGSGDPFASKNFRKLMQQLTPDAYPDLKFHIMTNAMLFTPKQWETFPSLHGRVEVMKISIDAATGPTHELLRRGARWDTMMDNMKFAGRLHAEGLIDEIELVFTVQGENWREMGDAVDLMEEVGASGIYFGRMTNWGTFSDREYGEKAIFLPSHPDHAAFVEAMQDDRLKNPKVILGDLANFVRGPLANQRLFNPLEGVLS